MLIKIVVVFILILFENRLKFVSAGGGAFAPPPIQLPEPQPPPTLSSSSLIISAPAVNQSPPYTSNSWCSFETLCPWFKWYGENLRIVTGQEVSNSWVPIPDVDPPGPFVDADNNTHGHFLYTSLKKPDSLRQIEIRTERFRYTSERCKLKLSVHMANMALTEFKLILDTNGTSKIASDKYGDDDHEWKNFTFNIGRIRQDVKLLLEIYLNNNESWPAHLAIDNINLTNCFPDPRQNTCSAQHFQCGNNTCIESNRVCDIQIDCPNGEDEEQDCLKIPFFARCTFETGWCGWHNSVSNRLNWTQNSGATATSNTGPNFDYTYKNISGMYLYVDMTGKVHDMGTASDLDSPIINPPPRYHSNDSSPYYKSCTITFRYHKYGPHSGSLALFLIEILPDRTVPQKLWWKFGDRGNQWWRQVVTLPANITHRYFLQFEARKSFAARGDPAIDDIAMSPKCFGIGVPASHLNGYDYENGFVVLDPTPPPLPHQDFVNATYYQFTTCGKTGRLGPKPEDCEEAYNNTDVSVEVLTEKTMAGIQKWIVPHSGFYTIIAKGASGGKGSDDGGLSFGAAVSIVVELKKGQVLYILVGQEGHSACVKKFFKEKRTVCQQSKSGPTTISKNRPLATTQIKLKEIKKLQYLPEGGGGGGATYIFTMKKIEKVPLIIAAGGGGLGHGSSSHDVSHHGHGINKTLSPNTGDAHGPVPAGAGGGWFPGNLTYKDETGLSLVQGATGGRACYSSSDGSDKGAGGFGGGGGGCTAGGGGGGYTGGKSYAQKAGVGEGGYSHIETTFESSILYPHVWVSDRRGPGEVLIIPALLNKACGCDYRCVVLDVYRHKAQCLCQDAWTLGNNSRSCIQPAEPDSELSPFTTAIIAAVVIVTVILCLLLLLLYNRMVRKQQMQRRKMLNGPDAQLNRLRMANNSMITEYNPNYEFGGSTVTVKDLKEVIREHLKLVRPLGQGAFGEVYQGFYKNRPGDTIEMPVAVKTLPELSTSQSEADFLMEALIMSKFHHPNIIHFIGVCFDKHPRYIVIELLAGGDLKAFLRECRPKPDRPSQLKMNDLLNCILDIAKGCKYMEELRFIHRDIAARNCLLTSKGPGRVVKIADFGMARDIYRSDYYKKGGKAMLPIKWMPPEAFLDGIFTSKTDVWSFGVLMWEVMSLGYMPYTGLQNTEVMTLVINGGRLEPPASCPKQLYAIMTSCWHPNPEERPNFATIVERVGYCMQDPDVVRTPLPVYLRGFNSGGSEQDTTVMRPCNNNSNGFLDTTACSYDTTNPDYLVPLPGPLLQPHHIGDKQSNHVVSNKKSDDLKKGNPPPTNYQLSNHITLSPASMLGIGHEPNHIDTSHSMEPLLAESIAMTQRINNNLPTTKPNDGQVFIVSQAMKQDTPEITC